MHLAMTSPKKILLIDDDVALSAMLKEFLSQEGFVVDAAFRGDIGAKQALSENYHLILFDMMMPCLNGIEVLRLIRESSQVPVLMLTAIGDDADRILGLEYGADDYVAKPCTPREISARIRAILRRVNPPIADVAEVLEVGFIKIFPHSRKVEWHGQTLDLTSTEYNLLECLVRKAGQPVSKNELSEYGLGRKLAKFDRNIDVHVSSLRQKLNRIDDAKPAIQTVYRLGYQFLKE